MDGWMDGHHPPTHTHTNTRTHTRPHTPTHTYTDTHTPTLTHTHLHWHTHRQTHTDRHTHTHHPSSHSSIHAYLIISYYAHEVHVRSKVVTLKRNRIICPEIAVCINGQSCLVNRIFLREIAWKNRRFSEICLEKSIFLPWFQTRLTPLIVHVDTLYVHRWWIPPHWS